MGADRAARTAVVLANPAARRALPAHALESGAEAMRARGWDVRIEEATSPLDSRERAARHARAGVDALLACGGDGTLLTVVNGVLSAGAAREVAVGVVPGGTANVWAGEAGIPRRPRSAIGLIEYGARRRVDVGVARIGSGPRIRFLLVCGVGIDAAVIEAVEDDPRWKRRFGRLAFGPPAVRALLGGRGTRARVTLDGEEMTSESLLLAVTSNNSRYGGVARLAADTAIDDGVLEVATFEAARSPVARLRLAVEALRGRLDERRVEGVTHRQAHAVTIAPERPLPVEVDGDGIGRCGPGAPLRIEVEHRALTMIFGAAPEEAQ